MKRKLVLIMLVIVLTMFFTGCKKNEEVKTNPTPQLTPTQQTTTKVGEQELIKNNEEAQKGNTLTDEDMKKSGEEVYKQFSSIYLVNSEQEYSNYINKTFASPSMFKEPLKDILEFNTYTKVDVVFENEQVAKVGENGFIFKAKTTKKITDKSGKVYDMVSNGNMDVKKDKDGNYKITSMDFASVK